jgi:dimethylamine monooxygenase subunit A
MTAPREIRHHPSNAAAFFDDVESRRMSSTELDPQLFVDEDFRFRLGTVPGQIEEFFARSQDAPSVLAERQHWLRSDPERFVALMPDSAAIVEELLELVRPWSMRLESPPPLWSQQTPLVERLVLLSSQWEPDLVLLAPDSDGSFHVVAGCVCFPSSWRLTDKLGQPVSVVHQPVPGLNDALGPQIDRLMSRLRPGRCLIRANWSVCRQPELNQHPDRQLPPLTSPVTLDDAWLRREDQCLFTLPRTQGIVFGIRVSHTSWRELRAVPAAARSVARTLRTMSGEMLHYKRLTAVAEELARLLESADSRRSAVR